MAVCIQIININVAIVCKRVKNMANKNDERIKPTPCTICAGFMHTINKYLNVDIFSYSEQFPLRFPWKTKTLLFKPLLNYIEELGEKLGMTHHFIVDLTHLNAILDYRYRDRDYSVGLAIEEYYYMNTCLNYICTFFNQDKVMFNKITVLRAQLLPELCKANRMYYYRPCANPERCGGGCGPGEQYSKEARLKDMNKFE